MDRPDYSTGHLQGSHHGPSEARNRMQAWFFDEYTKYGGHAPGVVTGKPINMHGSHGRASATGRGTTFGIVNMLDAFGEESVKGKKFVIQVCAVHSLPFCTVWCKACAHGMESRASACLPNTEAPPYQYTAHAGTCVKLTCWRLGTTVCL